MQICKESYMLMNGTDRARPALHAARRGRPRPALPQRGELDRALDHSNGGYRTERRAGIHDNARVKPLAECGDPASLTCAIQELCAEKGVLAHVDVWTLAGSEKRQALCFVRTDRAAREERLAGTPGLTRFGNELLFIVELPARAPNPR